MAEILTVTRWRRRKVDFYGTPVVLEMKALNKREATRFVREFTKLFGGADVDEALPTDQQIEAADELMERRLKDPFVVELFTERMRLPEPFKLDGVEITTPLQMLDESEPSFLLSALVQFQAASALGSDEGNASGSPSGSVPAAGQPGSSTDATSTGSEAAPEP